MDLVKFVQAIRRHLRIIIVAVLIGAALGAASSYLGGENSPVAKTRDYWQASATVGLNDSNAAAGLTAFGSVSRVATAATGPDVAELVATKVPEVGLDAVTIQSRLGTESDPNFKTIDIIAVSPDQQQAIALADATATQLVSYVDEQARTSLVQQRDDLSKQMKTLRDQRAALDASLHDPTITGTDHDFIEAQSESLLNQYRAVYDQFTNIASLTFSSLVTSLRSASAKPISPAAYNAFVAKSREGSNNIQIVPTSGTETVAAPSSSSIGVNGPIPRALLGALLGLIIGVVVALMLDFYDTRLHTREDFQRSLNAPVLAEIPKMNRREADGTSIMIRDAPMSRAAEAFRAVRSSLLFQREEVVASGRRSFVVMVTSPGPKEGKTTASANLAVAFAEAGFNTLAVNCDFRRPALRRMFGMENDPGKAIPTNVPRLALVTNAVADAGANPAQVVATQRAGIEQMRDRYDVIVLDTAPLLTTNDPIDVVSVADLVVLVVRSGQTRKDALRQAVEIMDNHKVPVAGVVLTGVTSVPNAYYYYYASDTARAARTAVKSNSEGRRSRAVSAGTDGGSNGKGGTPTGGNGNGDARQRDTNTLGT